MSRLLSKILIVFAAGCAGGLANSLVVWWCGAIGLTGLFGASIAPTLTPLWLYPRIVWGGIWGGLFLLPTPEIYWLRGLFFSLPPSLVQLLIVFPQAGKGWFGLDLGLSAPLFVLFFNAVWGLVAAYLLKQSLAGSRT